MSIKDIKGEALEEHIPILMDETLEKIKEILLKAEPKKILEIGTATGYSAICFSNILNNKVKIDTIELDHERIQQAKKNIAEMNLSNNINIIEGNAIEILPKLEEKYDIIFIDAAKGKYPIFLKEALRLSKKGSIILADNILFKGYVMSNYNKHKQRTAVRNLREYIKESKENDKLETEILEIGDGLAVSKII